MGLPPVQEHHLDHQDLGLADRAGGEAEEGEQEEEEEGHQAVVEETMAVIMVEAKQPTHHHLPLPLHQHGDPDSGVVSLQELQLKLYDQEHLHLHLLQLELLYLLSNKTHGVSEAEELLPHHHSQIQLAGLEEVQTEEKVRAEVPAMVVLERSDLVMVMVVLFPLLSASSDTSVIVILLASFAVPISKLLSCLHRHSFALLVISLQALHRTSHGA